MSAKDDAEQPKLHIDSDWKAQAQAEKRRLAEEAKKAQKSSAQPGGEASTAPGRLPQADFQTLVSTMVTQALFAMGAIPDPATGQRMAHLELARHHIDMLGVLEEKTRGNLSDEEQKLLSQALYELRMHYTQLAQAALAQMRGEGGGAGPAGPGGASGGEAGPITF